MPYFFYAVLNYGIILQIIMAPGLLYWYNVENINFYGGGIVGIVEAYFANKQKLMEYFDIDADYYVYNAINYKWCVKQYKEAMFLTINKNGSKKEDYVIVKRNNLPLIYEKNDFSLFVAIDCIKVAFIVKNTNQLADI